MLKIESIQNGIVIDHIPAGKGMDIYKLLELDSQKQSVALLQSVRSEKYGCKDLIKIEGLTEPERLEVLGYLNEGVTLIVIRDGKVVKKYHPVPLEDSLKMCSQFASVLVMQRGFLHLITFFNVFGGMG